MDRTIVLDKHDRFSRLAGPGTVKLVELFDMGEEVAAFLGPAGMHDKFACDMLKRAQDGDLSGLSRCRHPQISADLCPGPGEIGMRQRLALVAVEQNNITSFGLLFEQFKTQADPIDFERDLASLQAVPRPSPTELFLRNALDNCERLMQTPDCASTSARSRAIVQLGRSATGSSSRGVTTRMAASLFIGAGPGATRAFRASTLPLRKVLRQKRTVSSRTPNASAIRALVQPESVKSTARARSASPRSREPESEPSSIRSASVAETGERPVMSCTPKTAPSQNQTNKRWSTN